MSFLIQLTFSDSQAKNSSVKSDVSFCQIFYRRFFFTNEILCRLFFPIRYSKIRSKDFFNLNLSIESILKSGSDPISSSKNSIKITKNAFNFILKALLGYLRFCSDFFGWVRKQLDKKATANFKISDVTTWKTNNCNTHIAQYLKKLKPVRR